MFDTWCTLCLATAVISVVMIGPAMDEFLASLQHVKRARAEGRSTWRVFWGLDGHPTRGEDAKEPGGRSPASDTPKEPGLARP